MSALVSSEAEALIFDMDGTLVDTMAVHRQAWRETVEPYDIDMTQELFDLLKQLLQNGFRDMRRCGANFHGLCHTPLKPAT